MGVLRKSNEIRQQSYPVSCKASQQPGTLCFKDILRKSRSEAVVTRTPAADPGLAAWASASDGAVIDSSGLARPARGLD